MSRPGRPPLSSLLVLLLAQRKSPSQSPGAGEEEVKVMPLVLPSALSAPVVE